MGLPELEYHKIRPLHEEWNISQDRMFYFIENGLLRACIWLPLRYMERGIIQDGKFLFETYKHKEGFVALRPEDCWLVFSIGRTKLKIFKSIHEEQVALRIAYEPPQPEISVKIGDILILQEDKEKFENAYDLENNKPSLVKTSA